MNTGAMDVWHCLLLVAVLPLLINTVSGFSCYQCNSTLDHNCQEYFDLNNPNNPLRATACSMYGAKHCIKVTGLWGGIVGTHRFCSAKDLGNQCQDMRFPDHSRKYRGCIYTCSSDGCNSSSMLKTSTAAVITTMLSSLLLMWR